MQFPEIRIWAEGCLRLSQANKDTTDALQNALSFIEMHGNRPCGWLARFFHLGFPPVDFGSSFASFSVTARTHYIVLVHALLLSAEENEGETVRRRPLLMDLFALAGPVGAFGRDRSLKSRVRFRTRWERVLQAQEGPIRLLLQEAEADLAPGLCLAYAPLLECVRSAAGDDEVAASALLHEQRRQRRRRESRDIYPYPSLCAKRPRDTFGDAEESGEEKYPVPAIVLADPPSDPDNLNAFTRVQGYIGTLQRVLSTLDDLDQRAAIVVRALGGPRAVELFDLEVRCNIQHPELYREWVVQIMEANRHIAHFDCTAFATKIGFPN